MRGAEADPARRRRRGRWLPRPLQALHPFPPDVLNGEDPADITEAGSEQPNTTAATVFHFVDSAVRFGTYYVGTTHQVVRFDGDALGVTPGGSAREGGRGCT